MRLRTALLLLVAVLLTLQESSAFAVNVKVRYGAQNPVCKVAAEIANRISESDYWHGGWRYGYGSVDWVDDSYPTVTAQGREQRVNYSYVRLDIDNDRKQDIVIRYTGSMRSVDWDRIYVVQPGAFQVAKQADTVGQLLHTAPPLNPDNSVHFTNGSAGVPVEVEIWKHGGKNYIVLKEHFFAKRERSAPASLFVGRFLDHKPVQSQLGGSPRLVLELICRMSSQ